MGTSILRATVLLVLASCGNGENTPQETVVSLGFFEGHYDGARVCVEGVCGIVGETRELVIVPALRGSEFTLEVTMNGVHFLRDHDYSRARRELGGGATRSFSLGLYQDFRDVGCAVYMTNLAIGRGAIAALPPAAEQFEPCGPFQVEEP
ncbi:MAG: hypothetical protein AAF411_06635 [Myxococcota bacterium]